MEKYKFKQAYNLTKSPMLGGTLIKAFSEGEIVKGTPRVQQLAQWGAPDVNWVDTQWGSIPVTFLEPVSNSHKEAATWALGFSALLVFLKWADVI
jgi:hypothetical protein